MDASGLHSKIQVLFYLVASQIKLKLGLSCRACDNGEVSRGVDGGKLVSPRRRDCWKGPRELLKRQQRGSEALEVEGTEESSYQGQRGPRKKNTVGANNRGQKSHTKLTAKASLSIFISKQGTLLKFHVITLRC